VNELTGKPVRKGEAALQLWSHALGGEAHREEIFKGQCTTHIITLLEKGDHDDKFAAVGLLSVLVLSDKHIQEVVNGKVISSAAQLLMGEHSRSKQPASQLLSYLAHRAEYSSRVADLALPALMEALMDAGPGWAQARQTQYHAAAAIKSLIENVQGESSETKQQRRLVLLEMGAIPVMIRLIGYEPRLPIPAHIPAPPPPMGKKGPAKSAAKDAKKAAIPAGRKDRIATVAAACMRFLALCPKFVDELIASGTLQPFVTALLTPNEELAAYIAGILWEICAEQDVARQVLECGAVPALLHVCSTFLAAAAAKKTVKKKKKGERAAPSRQERGTEPPPPPNYADAAVCNAAGALHHLTFLDDAKLQVGRCTGIPILAACLRTPNIQTYENATGALWNVGLDANNTAALMNAGTPDYLAQPVPESWLGDRAAERKAAGLDAEELQEEEGGGTIAEEGPEPGPSTTFLTQQASGLPGR